jgi:hypothetical protein
MLFSVAKNIKKKSFVFQERILDMSQDILSKRQERHMEVTRMS